MTKWSDEQREQALAMLRDGVGTNETARRTGVPAGTLSRWATEAGIESARAEQTAAAANATKLAWAQRRGQLVDRFGEVAAKLLDRTEDAEDAGDTKNLITAAAIAVDKAQLLSGGATSRSEQVGLDRQRERVLAMKDELAERRAVNDKDGTTGG